MNNYTPFALVLIYTSQIDFNISAEKVEFNKKNTIITAN